MVLMLIEKLEAILLSMDIPEMRRKITPTNARWLLRNMRVQNGDHQDIELAVDLAKQLVSRRTQW